MKIKSIVCLVLAFVLLHVAISAQTAVQTKELKVSGLKSPVTVRRDVRGIPYIEAKTDDDLYFAQGFVTASDRLWQMDLLRRVSRGQLAEIFGATVLKQDQQWRRYGFSKIADDSLPLISAPLRNALENYARGVNAYIATLDAKSLPVEFQILSYKPTVWKATDTLTIGKILAEGLSSTWQQDLIRASLKDLPADKRADLVNQITPYDVVLFGKDVSGGLGKDDKSPLVARISEETLEFAKSQAEVREQSLTRIGFFAEELAASNNWVISGKRTADGKAILANDPHLQPAAPGIWYLSHLSTPTMRVSGVTFPGVPGIVLGHNENIAWGATNVGPDVQDLYTEQFDTNGKYKTPSGWAEPVIRKEEIKVRKSLVLPETETQTLDVTETRNGVIISDEIGQKFALKWTARDPKNSEFEAFFNLNRAKNWEEFKNSLKTYGGATQNFVYADVKGNIGWYAAGRIPIRKSGDGSVPFDGSTDAGDWVGTIPFEELPNLYNPPNGFIVTANQRITGTDYKYSQISRDAATPWRARRIYDLLNANTKVTMNDVTDIQRDVFNQPLTNLTREIVKLEAASSETLAVLRGWDGKMTADSKGALLVNSIRNLFADKLASTAYPAPSWVVRERVTDMAVREKPARWLPKEFVNYTELFKACDKEARENLTKKYGADESKWIWGAGFKSNFPHPLTIAPLVGLQFAAPNIGINGSGQTPNVGSNVSMRHIASPGNWDATRHVIPLGESGDPQSPHFKDQFDSWRTGAPQIFPFSKPAVEKATTEVLKLNP